MITITTKTDLIREIEDGMGSEGTHAAATKFYEICRDEEIIMADDRSLFWAKQLSDEEFFDIWDRVDNVS